MGDLVQREHPQIRVEYGWGQEHKNLPYLRNGARYDQSYYDGLIGSRICSDRSDECVYKI